MQIDNPARVGFSQDSFRVFHRAREEATDLHSKRVGSEHLLLGLLHLGRGQAARMLDVEASSLMRRATS